jgi:hypothetical protein
MRCLPRVSPPGRNNAFRRADPGRPAGTRLGLGETSFFDYHLICVILQPVWPSGVVRW